MHKNRAEIGCNCRVTGIIKLLTTKTAEILGVTSMDRLPYVTFSGARVPKILLGLLDP